MDISLGPRIKTFLFILLFIFSVEMNAKEHEVDYEVFVDEVVSLSAIMVKNELGLTCIGTGGQMPRDIEGISIKFICDKPASIEEARRLEVIITQKFLENINTHEKIRTFLRVFPFKCDRVQVSVSFVDENTGDYFNGVAYASLARGAITYYKFDNTEDDLIEIAVEPYEDALKKYQKSIDEK